MFVKQWAIKTTKLNFFSMYFVRINEEIRQKQKEIRHFRDQEREKNEKQRFAHQGLVVEAYYNDYHQKFPVTYVTQELKAIAGKEIDSRVLTAFLVAFLCLFSLFLANHQLVSFRGFFLYCRKYSKCNHSLRNTYQIYSSSFICMLCQ